MDKHIKLTMVSLLLYSRLYQALPAKAIASLLSKLSDTYPSLFDYQHDDGSDETFVGYEAAWAGVGKQFE
jgi:hypothetical protein